LLLFYRFLRLGYVLLNMIRFFLLQNRLGKTRLSKWFVTVEEDEKRRIENEVFKIVTARDSKFTNFVEFKSYKLVYRRYAGLYFILCVDVRDNELAYLEGIHNFVETLDRYFGNVCELDLVFNFTKTYVMLDEFMLGGELLETSRSQMLLRMAEIESALEA